MAEIRIARRAARRQHPWVFSNEVLSVSGRPAAGDAVVVIERDRLAGSAIYSPHSLIRGRLFTSERRELDLEFVNERLTAAVRRRSEWLPAEQDYRLVHGESDGLPGLVIDRYGRHFALQAYSAGMDRRLPLIIDGLRSLLDVQAIWAKNDFALRDLEGLPRSESVLLGSTSGEVLVSEGGVRFRVDIAGGQKTGFYFDQRVNRGRIRSLSAGKSVLDLFAYSGGFAVNAAVGGAERVTAIDSSEPACELAVENAALNGVAGRIVVQCRDAFDAVRELHSEKKMFDLIIVDPPAFARSQRDKPRALRGYRDVNLQAMRLLAPGGILLSCTCSQHVSWTDLAEVLIQAAQASRREFRIIERNGQGPDHPVLLHMPESDYLRSFLIQLT
jgi:23S rRNA (cytosine1962-C5)-methyltransferase